MLRFIISILTIALISVCSSKTFAHGKKHHVHHQVTTKHTVHPPVKHLVSNPLGDPVKCLASVVYHEARGEPDNAKIHVGLVALNRVGRFGYPPDVCSVVHQRNYVKKFHKTFCQFTWYCHPDQRKVTEPSAYAASLEIAKKTLEIFKNKGPTNELVFMSSRNYSRKKYHLVGVYGHLYFLWPKKVMEG